MLDDSHIENPLKNMKDKRNRNDEWLKVTHTLVLL